MPGRPLILALLPLVLWSGLLGGERTGPVSPGPDGRPAPGYVAWFKADAIMALDDGDPVSAWDDSGPDNQDATQPIASLQPSLSRSSIATPIRQKKREASLKGF
ncbi:MAG: hypothetical protein ACREMD_11435 [Gemmatimonadota bacterium]